MKQLSSKSRSLLLSVALAAIVAIPFTLHAAPPLPGAIFTTDINCIGTDLNIYSSKDAVYLDGGPAHPGAAGLLPSSSYWVQVTDPSGASVLGKSATAIVQTNSLGHFSACYQLSAIVNSFSSSFTVPGYDDTPNAGGEYKVWVRTNDTFQNNSTKTDNFKVKTVSDPCSEDCQPLLDSALKIVKFYDSNGDGLHNNAEPDLVGWKVRIDSPSLFADFEFTPVVKFVDPTVAYTVGESQSTIGNWVETTLPDPQTNIGVTNGNTTLVEFGNLCLGPGGGLTLGFWSNKNGEKILATGSGITFLNAGGFNLRTASGAFATPFSGYSSGSNQFRGWLLSATATNMAYMLSAQLATMELNVHFASQIYPVYVPQLISGSSIISAPGLIPFLTRVNTTGGVVSGLSALGYISINDLMTAAVSELGLHANTTASGADRNYQEQLKIALDNANNNKSVFVQAPDACPYAFQ